ncbi:hypothetical protein [Streptomyces sp. NPDC050485]|uniref:hypothetical protein n=1 Tax=Streptomyces sp. NPDC050485 TaxID=3365617 RepID=UPI0037923C95
MVDAQRIFRSCKSRRWPDFGPYLLARNWITLLCMTMTNGFLAGTAAALMAVTGFTGAAHASSGTSGTDRQRVLDERDGKLTPENLRNKQAKAAQERRDGITPIAGSIPLQARTAADGTTMYVPQLADGTPLLQENPCGGVKKFCMYYNSNFRNAYLPSTSNISNFAGYEFSGRGDGVGQDVKNNAASVIDHRIIPLVVYYNSGYAGPRDRVNPKSGRNLDETYNENASARW